MTIDLSGASPSPYTSNETTFSRRSSRTSFSSLPKHSPLTPRQQILRRSTSGASSISISNEEQQMNGMGSLADELGEGWGEDAVEDQSSFLDGLREGSAEPFSPDDRSINVGDMHDFGMGMMAQSPPPPIPDPQPPRSLKNQMLSPLPNGNSYRPLGHRKTDSAYDGSDYGPESENEDLPPTLLRRISDIESLIRISTHTDDVLSENGGVVPRTTKALKDLGAQASIENGATRLITAYTSMSMHRTHKTKELLSQSHSLLFAPQAYGLPSPAQLLEEEVLDDLLHTVDELRDSIPVTSGGPSPLLSLQILVSNTADLVYSLRSLADVLQESKVAVTTAGRKLKSVRDLVADFRLEEELREEGMRYVEKGNWERRLQDREGAKVCRDVVNGFERTCEVWRERLLAGAGGGEAARIQEVAA